MDIQHIIFYAGITLCNHAKNTHKPILINRLQRVALSLLALCEELRQTVQSLMHRSAKVIYFQI